MLFAQILAPNQKTIDIYDKWWYNQDGDMILFKERGGTDGKFVFRRDDDCTLVFHGMEL